MKRKIPCILALFLAVALLLTNFNFVYANLSEDKEASNKIPDILLRWAEYKADGNLTILKQLTDQIAEQNEWNEKVIESTNGAVLQPPEGAKYAERYITVDEVSEDMINPNYPSPWDVIGFVQNGANLGGTSIDGNWARLAAINYYGDIWGEALTDCHPNAGTITGGNFYAYAKTGDYYGSTQIYPSPGTWTQYLIAQVALNPDDMYDWSYVGYAQVYSSSGQYYFLGDASNLGSYNRVSISSMCPNATSPVERSDIYVDFVKNVIF